MDQTAKRLSFATEYSLGTVESSYRKWTQTLGALAAKAFFLGYKLIIGPALHTLGGVGYGCRYHPTCSEYCLESFQKHSLLRAAFLSGMRVLRCNPWIRRDFFDPVPLKTVKEMK
jgi:putative membrane protein insertion efficiency factor